jgi:hypothetical protein
MVKQDVPVCNASVRPGWVRLIATLGLFARGAADSVSDFGSDIVLPWET